MKRILVVMTASRSSRVALEEAILIAGEHGARLRLARVLGLHRSAAAMNRAEEWLERVEGEVPRAMRDGVVTLVGPASLAIRRAAEAYAADAVVIGIPAYGALVRTGIDAAFVDAIGTKLMIVHPVEETYDESTEAEAPKEARDETTATIAEVEPLLLTGKRLDAEHHRLEQLCEALTAAHVEGDWAEVRAEWDLLESALRAHMTMEERALLPLFRQSHPVEAQALLAEHIELRSHLDELAMDIELHAFGANRLRDFVDRLRAHGRREEALLYPWLDRSTSAVPQNPLAA
jgi:iron-sulfur cluster repair protein YtfE (RIC family)